MREEYNGEERMLALEKLIHDLPSATSVTPHGNFTTVYTLAMERGILWSFVLNCVDSLDRTQKRTEATLGRVLPIRIDLNDNNLRDYMSPSPASIFCFRCIVINVNTKHGRGV
jgi:hypothetical protein